MTGNDTDTSDSSVRSVDPFAYQPGIASKIKGLAAGGIGGEPSYVFHTEYLEFGRGMMQARIRFIGLRAKNGSLQVRVHMQTAGPEGRLMLVNSERIAFSRLILQNGELVLSFEALSGCKHAIYGNILGDTDAVAEGLVIEVECVAEAAEGGAQKEVRNTGHGPKEQPAARALV